jgi:hypothetical protein
MSSGPVAKDYLRHDREQDEHHEHRQRHQADVVVSRSARPARRPERRQQRPWLPAPACPSRAWYSSGASRSRREATASWRRPPQQDPQSVDLLSDAPLSIRNTQRRDRHSQTDEGPVTSPADTVREHPRIGRSGAREGDGDEQAPLPSRSTDSSRRKRGRPSNTPHEADIEYSNAAIQSRPVAARKPSRFIIARCTYSVVWVASRPTAHRFDARRVS